MAALDLGDQLLADTASEPAAAEAAIIQEDICVREPASPGVGGPVAWLGLSCLSPVCALVDGGS